MHNLDKHETGSATEDITVLGRSLIDKQVQAIAALIDRVDDHFGAACEIILNCSGKTVVTGMGKSSHVANKFAATLASTGTPAFFIHPGEASHGDLGMITKDDVLIILSNSGETEEVVRLLPVIKRLKIPLITLSGNNRSTLAAAASVNIDVSVREEACPLGLAPTSSTSAAMVMGDTIAIALLQMRGFNKNDFALSHPGGILGRRLLLHVSDIMHTGDAIPHVQETALLREVLIEMTQKGLGTTAIVDNAFKVKGIFTDGDLRRALDAGKDINHTRIGGIMSRNCKTAGPDLLAVSALALMEEHKINALLITDETQRLTGILNMHDLLRAKVI